MMKILLIILSLLGFADSTFLVWDSLSVTEHCGALLAKFGIAACNGVTESMYGTFLGYPISIFGMMGYSCIGILTFMGRNDENYRKGIFVIASSGFLFSLYLTYIQWNVLESWCFFCLISAGLMTFIFLISLVFLGSVSRYIKKRRYDLRRSFMTFGLIAIFTLIIFEAVRGRLLYHQGTFRAETVRTMVAGQDTWVGVIAEEFVSLHEINALTGAIEPAYRKTAFDYILLEQESVLSDLTLEEMITHQTALRLFPPQPPQTDEGVNQGATNVDIHGETSGNVNEASTHVSVVTVAQQENYEERRFRAYLGFLGRAEQKNKLEVWEQYLAELKVKHNAKFMLP